MPPFAKRTEAEAVPLRRVFNHPFSADCTLYLADETLVRKTIEGSWYSPHETNETDWQINAEQTLEWLVGTLHHHDPRVRAKVIKHRVHKWVKKPPAQMNRG